VIPLLFDGVKLPTSNQLPNDIANLAFRHALEFRHASFHSDMDKLIGALKRSLDRDGSPAIPLQSKDRLELSQSPDGIQGEQTWKGKVLRFRDDVYGDPVSVKLAVASARKGEERFSIEWPSAMPQCLNQLRNSLTEAEDYQDPKSIFHGADPDDVANFTGGASSTIQSADGLRISAHKRVITLIRGMERYWAR